MSEKKEFLKLAEELFEVAYEEGKEDGKDEAFASLSGLSLDDLSEILHDSGGKAVRGVKKTGKTGRKAGGGKGGKRVRRTAEDIAALASKIHTVVKNGGKDGVSAETIREKLGIERKELPRAIAEALGQRLILKRGQKRATLYFAGSKTVGKPKGGARKTKKKAASKKSKRPAKSKAAHTNGVTAAAVSASAPTSAE